MVEIMGFGHGSSTKSMSYMTKNYMFVPTKVLGTDPWSDEIEKTQVAVGLALKQSDLLDTDGTILLI